MFNVDNPAHSNPQNSLDKRPTRTRIRPPVIVVPKTASPSSNKVQPVIVISNESHDTQTPTREPQHEQMQQHNLTSGKCVIVDPSFPDKKSEGVEEPSIFHSVIIEGAQHFPEKSVAPVAKQLPEIRRHPIVVVSPRKVQKPVVPVVVSKHLGYNAVGQSSSSIVIDDSTLNTEVTDVENSHILIEDDEEEENVVVTNKNRQKPRAVYLEQGPPLIIEVDGELVEEDKIDINADKEAMKYWQYPIDMPPRDYQREIVETCLFNNTLVCLPTGLGKTFIAATVVMNYYRWFPEGKIVFIAHTKPLVMQQIKECQRITGISEDKFFCMTGDEPPLKRRAMWKERRIFFSTPQTLFNDSDHGICPTESIRCLILDEAHHCVGNSAYTQAVKTVYNFTHRFRCLGFTASPGTTMKAVQEVIENIFCSQIEVRLDTDKEIKKYLHEKSVETISVELCEPLTEIRYLYERLFVPLLEQLFKAKVMYPVNICKVTKHMLITAREQMHASTTMNDELRRKCEGFFAKALTLQGPYELLLFHGLSQFAEKIEEIQKESEFSDISYKRDIVGSVEWRQCLDRTRKIVSIPGYIVHPKITALQKVMREHFAKYGDKTRVMVFASYRQSVNEICHAIEALPGVRPEQFIGHSTGKSGKGLNQKEQQEIVNSFRNGDFNVLVATNIGEEGLDIGEVDLIVCYDAQSSPTRYIQRIGRTGRKRDGRVVELATAGEEEGILQRGKTRGSNLLRSIRNSKSLSLYRTSPRMVPDDIIPKYMEVHVFPEHHDETPTFIKDMSDTIKVPEEVTKVEQIPPNTPKERDLLDEIDIILPQTGSQSEATTQNSNIDNKEFDVVLPPMNSELEPMQADDASTAFPIVLPPVTQSITTKEAGAKENTSKRNSNKKNTIVIEDETQTSLPEDTQEKREETQKTPNTTIKLLEQFAYQASQKINPTKESDAEAKQQHMEESYQDKKEGEQCNGQSDTREQKLDNNAAEENDNLLPSFKNPNHFYTLFKEDYMEHDNGNGEPSDDMRYVAAETKDMFENISLRPQEEPEQISEPPNKMGRTETNDLFLTQAEVADDGNISPDEDEGGPSQDANLSSFVVDDDYTSSQSLSVDTQRLRKERAYYIQSLRTGIRSSDKTGKASTVEQQRNGRFRMKFEGTTHGGILQKLMNRASGMSTDSSDSTPQKEDKNIVVIDDEESETSEKETKDILLFSHGELFLDEPRVKALQLPNSLEALPPFSQGVQLVCILGIFNRQICVVEIHNIEGQDLQRLESEYCIIHGIVDSSSSVPETLRGRKNWDFIVRDELKSVLHKDISIMEKCSISGWVEMVENMSYEAIAERVQDIQLVCTTEAKLPLFQGITSIVSIGGFDALSELSVKDISAKGFVSNEAAEKLYNMADSRFL